MKKIMRSVVAQFSIELAKKKYNFHLSRNGICLEVSLTLGFCRSGYDQKSRESVLSRGSSRVHWLLHFCMPFSVFPLINRWLYRSIFRNTARRHRETRYRSRQFNIAKRLKENQLWRYLWSLPYRRFHVISLYFYGSIHTDIMQSVAVEFLVERRVFSLVEVG